MKKFRMLERAMAKLIIAIIFLFLCTLIYADPGVISVTMNPANPGWGQQFTVTMQYCADEWDTDYLAIAVSTANSFQAVNTSGQVFLVSSSGVNVPTASPSGNIGITLIPPTYTGDCNLCTGNGGNGTGSTVTETYTLNMPSSLGGSGCGGGGSGNLYLLVGLDANYMQGTSGGGANQSWLAFTTNGCGNTTTFAMPANAGNYVSVTKTVDGTLAQTGDLVLFSMNYSYGGGDMSLTDTIPGGGSLTLVNYGPNPAPAGGSVTAPAIGANAGSFSWYFPTSNNVVSGTAWMLLQMTNAIAPGTVISNTASGISGANTSSSVTSTTVESVSMSLGKSASLNGTVASGSAAVTYTLTYSINEGDYTLEDARLFNDSVIGTYTVPTSPPPGWKMLPDGNGSGQYGTWTISDACGTGNAIITGSVTGAKVYPALLLDDPSGNTDTVQFCDGIIEADVYINEGSYPGSDGLVVIRSNGQTGANQYAYSLILSIDTSPAYVAIQRVPPEPPQPPYNPSLASGGSSNSYQIYNETWYRVKIVVSNNGFTFNVKVWQVGTPEPAAYLLTWTDNTGSETDPNWACNGTYNDWRPGVGEQGNDQDGSTQDSYNNFKVFAAREIADAVLYDTIPAGLAYTGSSPAGGTAGQMVTWSLGEISNTSGSYTWWAAISGCGSFTNTAMLNGVAWCNNPIPLISNQVNFNISCGTSTVTPTLTPYLSPTYTTTTTITPTYTVTPTFTPTPLPFSFQKVTEYPNPAGPNGVYIVYNLSVVADVTARFYTISGEYIGDVEQQNAQPGNNQTLYWNLKNSSNNGVASGIYLYVIEAVQANNKVKAHGKIAVMK